MTCELHNEAECFACALESAGDTQYYRDLWHAEFPAFHLSGRLSRRDCSL